MKRILLLFSIMLLSIFSNSDSQSTLTTSSPLTEINQINIEKFIDYMEEWGYYYPELAGCERLYLYVDDEVKNGTLLVNGGDWAMYDRRGYSGVYGVSHENGEIFPITLHQPEKYNVDIDKPPIEKQVDAITLMYCFQWFSDLFITWAHRDRVSPFYLWETAEEITQDYLAEKEYFIVLWILSPNEDNLSEKSD